MSCKTGATDIRTPAVKKKEKKKKHDSLKDSVQTCTLSLRRQTPLWMGDGEQTASRGPCRR